MSLEQLHAFFRNIAATAAAHGRVRFIWHGGEPLLIPLQVYEDIGKLQREVFPPTLAVVNLVQTNLTVLTDAQLEFLREKRFFADGLGVSFDVYGDQRIDVRGRLRTETVIANLQRLQDAGIRFGAITVLARNTLPKIVPIFRFYEALGIGFRLLPFYKSANASQLDAHALGFAEITGALKAVFDAWWVSERATPVHPLDEYLRYASAAVGGAPKTFHDPPAASVRSWSTPTARSTARPTATSPATPTATSSSRTSAHCWHRPRASVRSTSRAGGCSVTAAPARTTATARAASSPKPRPSSGGRSNTTAARCAKSSATSCTGWPICRGRCARRPKRPPPERCFCRTTARRATGASS